MLNSFVYQYYRRYEPALVLKIIPPQTVQPTYLVIESPNKVRIQIRRTKFASGSFKMLNDTKPWNRILNTGCTESARDVCLDYAREKYVAWNILENSRLAIVRERQPSNCQSKVAQQLLKKGSLAIVRVRQPSNCQSKVAQQSLG